MNEKQSLFNEYRNTQAHIQHAQQAATILQRDQESLGLTLGEKWLSWLTKRLYPEKKAQIQQREELSGKASAVHLNLVERETKAGQIGIKLPDILTRSPEQIRNITNLLDHIDQLTTDLIAQISTTQQVIEKWKGALKKGMGAEAADRYIETHRFPGKDILSTVTDVVSTWIGTQGLDTDDINAQLTTLQNSKDNLTLLQAELTKLSQEASTSSPQWFGPDRVPNLEIVEYADLITDILRKGKDIGSIASLLAQGYTYLKIDWLLNNLQALKTHLETIKTKSTQLRPQIAEYRQFDAVYTPPLLLPLI
jgi:hypothetical protein